MAAMTTVLTEAFGSNAGARTYTFSGNTFTKARKVIQKSKVGSATTSAEDRIMVVCGTEDDAGVPLQAVNSIEVVIRRPISGQSTDLDDAVTVFRDIVASDEFSSAVSGQAPLA